MQVIPVRPMVCFFGMCFMIEQNFDPKRVGKRIGSGADRIVYQYGEGFVVKFSTFAWIGGKKVIDKYLRDYQVCIQYLGDYIVPTQWIVPTKGRKLIEIQPMIQGQFLHAKHIENPVIREQVAQIYESVRQMQVGGYAPLDLIGRSGLTQKVAENIWVDQNHRLHILDTSLLETKTAGVVGLFLAPFMPLTQYRQKQIFTQWLKK